VLLFEAEELVNMVPDGRMPELDKVPVWVGKEADITGNLGLVVGIEEYMIVEVPITTSPSPSETTVPDIVTAGP
jgi:hypothetical protein